MRDRSLERCQIYLHPIGAKRVICLNSGKCYLVLRATPEVFISGSAPRGGGERRCVAFCAITTRRQRVPRTSPLATDLDHITEARAAKDKPSATEGSPKSAYLTSGSSKRQQPHRLQVPAITRHRPFGLPR